MNIKKTVAIATAAGALAAISVPAMAFENEFHGLLNFNTTFSNFQNGASGDYSPAGTTEKKLMNNYFEQRVRLQYIAKASDDLKMVTHFEINNRFGNINTVAGTKGAADISGSDLDTDGMNLVTKHAYLDFNVGKDFNTKLGLMPYKDTIKGLFIDADIPAIMTTTKFGAYTLGVGFSRFADDAGQTSASTRLGGADKDLFMLDNTFAFNKDTKAALSYYFFADYTGKGILPVYNVDQDILLSTLALSGETKLGGLNLSGFAAMQAGVQKNVVGTSSGNYHGYAVNAAAKMAVGPGTAKTAFLFTSGDNNTSATSNKAWIPSGVSSYNEGGMMIIARSTANSPTSTDRYIRRNVTNLALLTMGYDANLTDKLFANGNVGLAWTPASGVAAGGTAHRADIMGAELNVETGYKLYSNLTLKAQAAYMVLGGLYKNEAIGGTATPENPYSMRLHAQYSF